MHICGVYVQIDTGALKTQHADRKAAEAAEASRDLCAPHLQALLAWARLSFASQLEVGNPSSCLSISMRPNVHSIRTS